LENLLNGLSPFVFSLLIRTSFKTYAGTSLCQSFKLGVDIAGLPFDLAGADRLTLSLLTRPSAIANHNNFHSTKSLA